MDHRWGSSSPATAASWSSMAAVASSVRLTLAVNSLSCRPARPARRSASARSSPVSTHRQTRPLPGGFLAFEYLAKEAHGSCALPAQQLAEVPELPTTGVDAHIEEADVEARARCADGDVASEGQVDPCPDRGTVDRRDRRHRCPGQAH